MRKVPFAISPAALVASILIAAVIGVVVGLAFAPRLGGLQLGRLTGATSSPAPTAPSLPTPNPTIAASPVPASPEASPVAASSARSTGSSGSGPSMRVPNLAYDSTHANVVLFGGYGGGGSMLDDTWVWDGAWTEKHPLHSPAGRWRASLVDEPATGSVLLFGGSTANGLYDDTWSWDGTDWRVLVPAISPSAREGAGVAYDALRKQVVLFGGQNRTAPYRLGDTWTWDGANWTLLAPAVSPSPRFLSWMAFDAARGVVVLLGGFDNIHDTWTWNGTGWTQQHPSGSPPDLNEATPSVHEMAYDPVLKNVVMTEPVWHSSSSADSTMETYIWNGATWTHLQPAHSPTLSYGAGFVFDTKRGVAVEWGGWATVPPGPNDTWTWNGADWVKA